MNNETSSKTIKWIVVDCETRTAIDACRVTKTGLNVAMDERQASARAKQLRRIGVPNAIAIPDPAPAQNPYPSL